VPADTTGPTVAKWSPTMMVMSELFLYRLVGIGDPDARREHEAYDRLVLAQMGGAAGTPSPAAPSPAPPPAG